jgi:hypothetical protein
LTPLNRVAIFRLPISKRITIIARGFAANIARPCVQLPAILQKAWLKSLSFNVKSTGTLGMMSTEITIDESHS